MSLQRTLGAMAAHDVDVLLLGREGNARFASNARRLFLASERAFAPGCVVTRAPQDVHVLGVGDAGISHEQMYPMSWSPVTLLETIVALPGVAAASRVGVDGLTPLWARLLGEFLPETELVDAEALMREARRRKSEDDLARIHAAVSVAEAVMTVALTTARAGRPPELIVAAAMEAMALHGTATAAFEPVVTAEGIDIGVLVDGWEGGLAREITGRGCSAEHRDRIARCRAGRAAPDRTHGVGLGYEVVPPDAALEPGMVLSVATGPLRDMVLVTMAAPEVMTNAAYD
jgi:Xaa-Pro aminopeptidase